MRISVLTATYNRSKYLKRLYESIVNNINDKYEIEWLIMDDGSTDDTENECKQMLETIMNGLKKKEEITEKLKENDGLEWVKRMNMLRALAEEIVTKNLIYV